MLARTLESLGFRQVAGQIFAHPTQYIETDFNVTKTWIEYVNRLLGALIGVLIFVTVALALPYWRRDKTVFWLAFASFVLTGFQGWLGSLVVSTNLLPEMVTVHMALALVIVALLIYAVDRSQRESYQEELLGHESAPAASSVVPWLWVAGLLTFVQIIVGTQVREQIDIVAADANYSNRNLWVEGLGVVFKFHRTFSALILLLNLYVAYQLYNVGQMWLRRLAAGILVVLAMEIGAGVVLAYAALPAAIQPVHLTLATVLFGIQFLTLIRCRRLTKTQPKAAYAGVVA